MSNFPAYLETSEQIPGFFMRDAMFAWDFLLDAQNCYGIRGHFLEIGVFEGKSATLGAHYLAGDEEAVLVDINPCAAALERVRRVKRAGVTLVQEPSNRARRSERIQRLSGRYRFIHIDGDHAGYSVLNDLDLAAQIMAEDGVICVDDFLNSDYIQVAAGVYKFLFDHPMSFRMVLCGANKCFLVKTASFRFYEEEIQRNLLDHSGKAGATFLLRKSSYAYDYGCFSLSPNFDGRPRRLVGLNSNIDDIPA